MSLSAIPARDRKLIEERSPLPRWRIRHLERLGWQLEMIETPSAREWRYSFLRASGAVGAVR